MRADLLPLFVALDFSWSIIDFALFVIVADLLLQRDIGDGDIMFPSEPFIIGVANVYGVPERLEYLLDFTKLGSIGF